MDDLVLRKLHGELSDIEERTLRNWRQSSPANEQRYQELVRLWAIEPAAGACGLAPPRPAADAIAREAERRRLAALPLPHRVLANPRLWAGRVVVAAAVLLVGFGLGELWTEWRSQNPFGAVAFVTGAGETATITLADGSFVRLAPNSHVRLPAKGREHEIWVDGRAYFAVEPDSYQPFTVHTRFGEARALGTHFEIRVRERALRLVVVEGRVALSTDRGTLEVGASEVSHVRNSGTPSAIRVANVSELLDWPGGLLVFRSMPLGQVARQLEHHFDVPVEVVDSTVARRSVTGRFTDESLDEVLAAVCRATAARCSIEDGQVRIADSRGGETAPEGFCRSNPDMFGSVHPRCAFRSSRRFP